MNILVVDDLPTNRKLLRVTLEPEGHTILEAEDGVAALEVLRNEPVDAVISDILMPRMDGYRLCFEVRNTPRLKDLPFLIFSSTYTSPADAKLAMEVGADKYLKKPCPTKALMEALKEAAPDPNKPKHHGITISEERFVMKEYSQVLVSKLETKNSELERTEAELMRVNRELEQLVKERTAELEQANADLEAFNRSVSHDLRGPLSEMQGYAQILQAGTVEQFNAVGREFAGKIFNAAVRMEGMIREFLKLAQAKQGQLFRQDFSLSRLATGIADRLREGQPARKAEFVVEPDLRAEADLQLIQIALENLLGNAWKFTSLKPMTRIQVGRVSSTSSSPSVAAVFFVRDNGAGFDAAQAGRMFKPFERLHAQSQFPGTGIGLTIVQRIVTRHGGKIWAEGEPGKGAAFYFTLQP